MPVTNQPSNICDAEDEPSDQPTETLSAADAGPTEPGATDRSEKKRGVVAIDIDTTTNNTNQFTPTKRHRSHDNDTTSKHVPHHNPPNPNKTPSNGTAATHRRLAKITRDTQADPTINRKRDLRNVTHQGNPDSRRGPGEPIADESDPGGADWSDTMTSDSDCETTQRRAKTRGGSADRPHRTEWCGRPPRRRQDRREGYTVFQFHNVDGIAGAAGDHTASMLALDGYVHHALHDVGVDGLFMIDSRLPTNKEHMLTSQLITPHDQHKFLHVSTAQRSPKPLGRKSAAVGGINSIASESLKGWTRGKPLVDQRGWQPPS